MNAQLSGAQQLSDAQQLSRASQPGRAPRAAGTGSLGPDTLGPGRPRILGGSPAAGLDEHEPRYGRLESDSGRGLLEEIEESGLRGRGGAGFPTHLKMRAVGENARRGLRRRRPVIVANGVESEPASAKDGVLLRAAPHLVLDGVSAAGSALGAQRAIICVDRNDSGAAASLRRALAERSARGAGDQGSLHVEIAAAPSRYVAGEETALVSWINGRESRPTFSPPRPSESGVSGAPTLVDNVETLANVALIARFGGQAYRQVGEADEPGTMLVTLRGAVDAPGVYEVPIGAALRDVVAGAGGRDCSGILVGGYFGTWLAPQAAAQVALSRRSLRDFGASPGCGLIAVMPVDHCPLEEAAAVFAWLASSSAGQCGACVNGLPALAGAFDGLVAGDRRHLADAQLERWSPMVTGRGACKMPDGAVNFLNSARRTFVEHVDQHRVHGPCPPNTSRILPVPTLGGWR